MKRHIRTLTFALIGAALTALGILLSRGLIYHLDTMAASIATAAGLDTETATHIALVFGQMKEAHIVSPWGLLPAGILLGLPASFNHIWTARRMIFCICAAVVLLILLIGVALILTEVNGIRVGALLNVLLPMLPALI